MTPFLSDLYAAALPALLTVLGAILTRAITAASTVAKARWGIEIEARHREALHSALMSGITAALSRGLAGSAAVAAAIEYAGRSVPDALELLDPTAEVLDSLAEAKLRQITGGQSELAGRAG